MPSMGIGSGRSRGSHLVAGVRISRSAFGSAAHLMTGVRVLGGSITAEEKAGTGESRRAGDERSTGQAR
jgi:hypothetical protein